MPHAHYDAFCCECIIALFFPLFKIVTIVAQHQQTAFSIGKANKSKKREIFTLPMLVFKCFFCPAGHCPPQL